MIQIQYSFTEHGAVHEMTLNSDMSCTVKIVIYVITCRECGKYYIGETNNLRKRTTCYRISYLLVMDGNSLYLNVCVCMCVVCCFCFGRGFGEFD